MSDLIALRTASHASRDLALSARPDAPVITDEDVVVPAPRRWTAARLRAVARVSYRMSNRLDPARLAGHRTA